MPPDTDLLTREIFLGFIKMHILHHAAQAPVYGVALLEELRRHGYALSPGTLYPVLHSLESAGYLNRAERLVGGKVRKYYSITPAGGAALDAATARLRELVAEVLEERGPANLPEPATSAGEEDAMEDLIAPETVQSMQEAGAPLTLLDVRAAGEYAAGHLPGARNLPADELERRLGELSLAVPVVTYCSMRHMGASRSERATVLLRQRGYDARTLEGGLPAWQAAGGAVEAEQ